MNGIPESRNSVDGAPIYDYEMKYSCTHYTYRDLQESFFDSCIDNTLNYLNEGEACNVELNI